MVPAQDCAPPQLLGLISHPVRWQLLTALAGSDLRVRELVTRAAQPQNLVSYHLRLLREGGLMTVSRSTHDGRDSYYHLDLDRCAEALTEAGAALHPALGPALGLALGPALGPAFTPTLTQHGAAAASPGVLERASVLFVCTGNSTRSPMAEAMLRQRTQGWVTVRSGGTSPQPHVQPHAVRALRDRFGIDLGERKPGGLSRLAGRRFDHVVTLCDRAREHLPELAGQPRRTHWSIPEPPAASYPAFERTAAEIDTRVRHLLPLLAAPDHREEARP